MKKNTFNKKGYSLIEVLTASAILCILAIAAGSFLISNLFSYKSASNNITLEREGRAALNVIIDTVRKGSDVAEVDIEGKAEPMRCKGLNSVSLLRFSETSQLRVEGGKLLLDGTTLCRTLNSGGFQVEPLPEGSDFSDCTGLRVKLALKKDNNTYNMESEAYFRNK